MMQIHCPTYEAHLRLAVLVCLLLTLFGQTTLVQAAETAAAAPELRLVFSGNERLPDSALSAAVAPELTDFFTTDFPEARADDAAFRIETLYKRQGYAFVRVGYRVEQAGAETTLLFTVEEGPRVLVRSVTVTGNTAFSSRELLAGLADKEKALPGKNDVPFVANDITDAIAAIRGIYVGAGFLEVRIDKPQYIFSPDRSSVDISLRVSEGAQTLVNDITFSGELLPEVQSTLAKVAGDLRGKPYIPRHKLVLRSGVLAAYGNHGYPEAVVEVRATRVDSARIDLLCHVLSGPRIVIAGVRVEGNSRTDAAFISKRLTLQPGDLYRADMKRESFRRLFRTGLFSRLVIDLAEGAGEARDLVVQVDEALAREVFLQAGWGSYELLRGSTGFVDRNIFGSGRSFRFEAGGSVKSASVEASITDPWLFGRDFTAHLPLFFQRREEPSFTREERGASFLVSREFGRFLTVSGRALYSSTTTMDLAVPDLPHQDDSYTIAGFRVQAEWDTRNDIFFPTSGERIFGSAEVADPAIGSDLSFYRFTCGLRKFLPLDERHTLAARYETGLILPGHNQDLIPIGERYFNGGENTVRSFREGELGPRDASGDPLGGMAFTVFSLEARRLITDNLAGSVFVDYGNIAPGWQGGDGVSANRKEVIDRTFADYFRDFRPALGVGIQYLLPIGPARLDCAWNPDREKGEDGFVVHFSIGMAF